MTEPSERRGNQLGQELCPRLEHIDLNHGSAQADKQANQGQQRPAKKVEELGAKTLVLPYVCVGGRDSSCRRCSVSRRFHP